jgi:hypothetical protein
VTLTPVIVQERTMAADPKENRRENPDEKRGKVHDRNPQREAGTPALQALTIQAAQAVSVGGIAGVATGNAAERVSMERTSTAAGRVVIAVAGTGRKGSGPVDAFG